MPLSKEKMREYMIEYRKNHPEYEKKRREMNAERFKIRYDNEPEFREKIIATSINYYQKKKELLSNPIIC